MAARLLEEHSASGLLKSGNPTLARHVPLACWHVQSGDKIAFNRPSWRRIMPMHDWTRVDSSVFHDFHVGWITEIRTALNNGLLPQGYYARAEQHAGQTIADVLTLRASVASRETEQAPLVPDTGGVAIAEAPPRTRRKHTFEPAAVTLRRSLAIRHISGHRLVALIEIVSPANKDRPQHVQDFTGKVLSALRSGVHVLVVDRFPPDATTPRACTGSCFRRWRIPISATISRARSL